MKFFHKKIVGNVNISQKADPRARARAAKMSCEFLHRTPDTPRTW